jgi:general secretion pathway protein D
VNNCASFVWIFLLTGCVSVNDTLTPQQKNLNNKAFEMISAPVEDFVEDTDFNDFIEDEIDHESTIDEKFYKKISISATENMKLREVLNQMANLAGVNIFIVNDVEGSISFSARNRPFLDILKDICYGAGLKYSIEGDSVKIEIDTPMLKIYNMQFLNIQRDSKSSVSVSTDIFANQSVGTKDTSASTGSTNNGSGSTVEGTVKNNFWTEVESSLKAIVDEEEGGYITVHKQGGLISAYTTQRRHNDIQKYLRLLKDTAESQVLIEAKILEVNLNNEYKSGIDWNILRGGVKFRKDFSEQDGLIAFGMDKANLSIISGLIEKFGAVKTLSSPRITVLNNQAAILKVAQNEVIYVPELQRQYATVSDSRSTDFLSTTIHTIPIGLIMSVLPSVDKKNNTILISLRPTISRIVNYKDVPFAYQITNDSKEKKDVQYHKVPIVDVRELDSVLKLSSGEIVVMGGLMQESSTNHRNGLPSFEEADFLTGSNVKSTNITELVIFLKATILRKKTKKYHGADKKAYNTFASDSRPLEFKK